MRQWKRQEKEQQLEEDWAMKNGGKGNDDFLYENPEILNSMIQKMTMENFLHLPLFQAC